MKTLLLVFSVFLGFSIHTQAQEETDFQSLFRLDTIMNISYPSSEIHISTASSRSYFWVLSFSPYGEGIEEVNLIRIDKNSYERSDFTIPLDSMITWVAYQYVYATDDRFYFVGDKYLFTVDVNQKQILSKKSVAHLNGGSILGVLGLFDDKFVFAEHYNFTGTEDEPHPSAPTYLALTDKEGEISKEIVPPFRGIECSHFGTNIWASFNQKNAIAFGDAQHYKITFYDKNLIAYDSIVHKKKHEDWITIPDAILDTASTLLKTSELMGYLRMKEYKHSRIAWLKFVDAHTLSVIWYSKMQEDKSKIPYIDIWKYKDGAWQVSQQNIKMKQFDRSEESKEAIHKDNYPFYFLANSDNALEVEPLSETTYRLWLISPSESVWKGRYDYPNFKAYHDEKEEFMIENDAVYQLKIFKTK
ncbi:MAG: hypothetical protein JJT94_03955 [Bernardetiaceae bacterium]|nr:hypothetical protein [Bernardetiaceae bacterium]